MNQEAYSRTVKNIPLAANSGLFINARGELDIDCSILGTKCSWPISSGVPQTVSYTWTVAPSSIQAGNQVTVNVSGLAPSALFSLSITPSTGPVQYIGLQADTSGNIVNAKVRLNDPQDAVIFRPIYPGGTPNIGQYSIRVLPCGEVGDECSCRGAVSITPLLTTSSLVSGQSTSLLLVVKNSNTCPISELNLPSVVLPAEFTAATPVILANISVPGKSSATFEFTLQVQNTTTESVTRSIQIPASSATYKCGGVTYSAGGGSASLTIAPATGSYCGLSIEEFLFVPASVPDGANSELRVTVKNVGSSPITNLTMPGLSVGGAGVTIDSGNTSIGFGSLASLAPGASHTAYANTYYSAIGALPYVHTLVIPAGYIYGTCNGSQITNGAQRTANLTLTP